MNRAVRPTFDQCAVHVGAEVRKRCRGWEVWSSCASTLAVMGPSSSEMRCAAASPSSWPRITMPLVALAGRGHSRGRSSPGRPRRIRAAGLPGRRER